MSDIGLLQQKPTSVAWDDNKVDLKTHISNFFRGIGVYNNALASEMCDRVYPHLNAAGVGAGMELKHFEYKCKV